MHAEYLKVSSTTATKDELQHVGAHLTVLDTSNKQAKKNDNYVHKESLVEIATESAS